MTSQPPTPARKPRRSGIVVPQRPKWHAEIAAIVIWAAGSGLARTWHVTIDDRTGIAPNDPGPLIGAIWHNRLAVAMPMWAKWSQGRPGAKVAALISASRDGALLARSVSYFGVKPIRGSSSRRGAQALLELTSAIRDGFNVVITPDGPRGPKYVVQPGIVSLAQVTERPIVPLAVRISKKKQLRSWDAFQIPLPFARCEAILGSPLRVSRDASADEREQVRLALQSAMIELNGD